MHACACLCFRQYVRMYICGFYIYTYLGIVIKNEHV